MKDVEERLAEVLRAHGITPGRNPDGVNDDPEKLDLYLTELEAESSSRRALIEQIGDELRALNESIRQTKIAKAHERTRHEKEVARLTALGRGLQAENRRLTERVTEMERDLPGLERDAALYRGLDTFR